MCKYVYIFLVNILIIISIINHCNNVVITCLITNLNADIKSIFNFAAKIG